MTGSQLGLTPDTAEKVRWGGLSVFYLVFAAAWTLMIASGIAYLYHHRDLPILRLRGLYTSFCAIFFLHMYWVSVQLGYSLGPIYTSDTEYWIMGTWFPLGIGLFQCANARFLWVAEGQRRCFHGRTESDRRLFTRETEEDGTVEKGEKPRGGVSERLKGWNHSTRMYAYVGTGLLVQVLCTVLMYLISRKWHSSFGIPGTEVHGSPMVVKILRGRGWEWWPTIAWQVFWAWGFAPYILWKTRGIHDTQGWRLQTVACCLAGLPASPLWLIAVYVPGMETINEYWIPPQWLAVSVMVTEMFTIFLPCYQVLRHKTLKQETLESIAQWETQHRNSAIPIVPPTVRRGSAIVDVILNGLKGVDDSDAGQNGGDFVLNEGVLTAGALEHVLRKRPEPLQEFAALRDFSGENIAFLTSVAAFKKSFPPSSPTGRESLHLPPTMGKESIEVVMEESLLERFNRALRIYAQFVSSRSEFQINICADQRQRLEDIFEAAAQVTYCDNRTRILDPIAPFDLSKSTMKEVAVSVADSSSTLGSDRHSSAHGIETAESFDALSIVSNAQFSGEIPPLFDEFVFDDAADSIKYLVLTNTWPKFVKERRESLADSVETADSHGSLFGMIREKYMKS